MPSKKARISELQKLYRQTGNLEYKTNLDVLRAGGARAQARKLAEKARAGKPGAVAPQKYTVGRNDSAFSVAANISGLDPNDARVAAIAQQILALNGGSIRPLKPGEVLNIPGLTFNPGSRTSSRFMATVTGQQDAYRGGTFDPTQPYRNTPAGSQSGAQQESGATQQAGGGRNPFEFNLRGRGPGGVPSQQQPSSNYTPATGQFQVRTADIAGRAMPGLSRRGNLPDPLRDLFSALSSAGAEASANRGAIQAERLASPGWQSVLANIARAGGTTPGIGSPSDLAASGTPAPAPGLTTSAQSIPGSKSGGFDIVEFSQEVGRLANTLAGGQVPATISAFAVREAGLTPEQMHDKQYELSPTGFWKYQGGDQNITGALNDALDTVGNPSGGGGGYYSPYSGRPYGVGVYDIKGAYRRKRRGGSGYQRSGVGGGSVAGSGSSGGSFGYVGSSMTNWRNGF